LHPTGPKLTATHRTAPHHPHHPQTKPNRNHPNHQVFDVQGVGVGDLVGDALAFLRRSAHLIQEHYPERSRVIMIVNAPSWFSLIWKRTCRASSGSRVSVSGRRCGCVERGESGCPPAFPAQSMDGC
jgi:hypothetical protein